MATDILEYRENGFVTDEYIEGDSPRVYAFNNFYINFSFPNSQNMIINVQDDSVTNYRLDPDNNGNYIFNTQL